MGLEGVYQDAAYQLRGGHTALLSLTVCQYLPLTLFYYAISSCVLQLDIGVLYHTHTVRGLTGFSEYGFHVILEVAGLIVSLVCLVS